MARMQRMASAVAAMAAAVLLGLVFLARPGAAAELRLLTWADYIAPEVIARFHKETGITVVPETIDDYTELRTRFLADPTRYDLVNPADYQVAELVSRGLLERIDTVRLPGYANILDGWRSPPYDPRNEWSVPFHWGTTSFTVDTGVYHGDIDSTRLIFDPPPELKDKVGFMIGAEETLRMLLIHLGLPACTSDRAVLEQAMATLRPKLHKDRIYTISTIVEALTSGRIAAGITWNGDALKAREAKPSLRFVYPREGVVVWSDVLAVPKGAPNREAALAFIDFLLQPANAALQTNYTRYANPVRGSDTYMDPALLDAPEVVVPSSARIQFFRSCGSEQMEMYSEIWDGTLQELVK
ncbi:MAG TPA: extracellular solute-binding protein [Azospirillum sp.]|nr:extracellular solute-binding protein [Azospirillum sp.]